MSDPILISICIPAYKRVDFLERLLQSVTIQTFRDFEVVVTDDSPDDSVKKLCEQYQELFPLKYFRNPSALGTPENWNEAIRRATGKWIKLIHDDDWLVNEHSLQQYVNAINKHPHATFFFSAYRNFWLHSGRQQDVFVNSSRYKQLLKQRATLCAGNVIGPPSVVLHLNDKQFFYDNKVKWVVDIEFYIRYLKTGQPVYIPEVLINVGIGEYQVTQETFRKREVEIPENFYLLNKTGIAALKNRLVYDAWWRLMRNLNILSVEDLRTAGYSGAVHPVLRSMIAWQKNTPRSLLTNGVFSKTIMFVHYLLNRNRLRQ
ncbi:glycosyltransferase family 2 protein [Niastella caeni]|uniref:Glycosyltransferase family 2 protein n=1 Tax=Niastella caeni TaxID=2569763 RepID=A0A4S8HZ64_9BACT|nr:glycosyltransferase family 2 protein [Niastella caeni]THU39464.1 glycosyltransferase family 2 protein [Niastella caeni]